MAVGSPPLGAGLVIVVAVGFAVGFVVAAIGEVVAVEPVVDGPVGAVLVGSMAVPLVEAVPPSGMTAVETVVGAVAVVAVVRPSCAVGFDPCEEAPATPTPTRATTP
jgi:hypothetical protein